MASQREQIGQQLRGLYSESEQSQLRLLLSQGSSEALARNLQYYEYILAARREKMQAFFADMQRLDAVQQKSVVAMQALQLTQAQLEKDRAGLLARQEERKKIVVALDQQLQGKGSELVQMQNDHAALQKVVEQIEKERALAVVKEKQRQQEELLRQQEEERLQKLQAQQKPATKPQQQPENLPPPEKPMATELQSSPSYSAQDLAKLKSRSFVQAKGAMPWPAKGKIANRFGESRKGAVKWDGVRIRAQAGSEVRAVHYGRVMYADWLRGQGLLIILDHGDGYMSLYSSNDVLFHGPGEWVQAGELIASVGSSGGEKDAGLYFEIRKNGVPQDPLEWISRK
ncbi:MAG TPA: peptidoglycan DD-metalloendopeptidase family protein [Pseudomonadales bacterium]|nr:peptidoglycan DD-metalloendopeptidase family protein [Pseudomonadales bacterium]